jgi:hypothetical protein
MTTGVSELDPALVGRLSAAAAPGAVVDVVADPLDGSV